MDIPLPGEPDLESSTLPAEAPPPLVNLPLPPFNIPLPSCGMEFNASAQHNSVLVEPPLELPDLTVPPPNMQFISVPPPILPPTLPIATNDPPDDANRYSPSGATADDDVVKPEPKAQKVTVLGKAQAKKRLLAFSMTKQGGGLGLSFGFSKKVAPKVNAGSAKAFAGSAADEDTTDSKDAKTNKPAVPGKKKGGSKKGPSREDRARAVITAIEEIKREEMLMRGVLNYNTGMNSLSDLTAPLPLLSQQLLLSGKPKEELEISSLSDKQKGAIESLIDSLLIHDSEKKTDRKQDDDKKKDDKKSSRRSKERRRSKDRHSRREERKKKRPTELPRDWAHFRTGSYKFEEVRRLKLKLENEKIPSSSRSRHRNRSRDRRSRSHEDRKRRKSPDHVDSKLRALNSDYDQIYKPFECASRIRLPFVAIGPRKHEISYPRSLLRFTKTRPHLPYCENPLKSKAFYWTRSELLSTTTPRVTQLMLCIVEGKNESTQLKQPKSDNSQSDPNLSGSLAALQVSYDENEMEENMSSSDDIGTNRKERSWFLPLSTWSDLWNKGEEQDGVAVNESDTTVKKESLDDAEIEVNGKKLDNSSENIVKDDVSDGSIQSDRKDSLELSAERTTVRSKWDSDYEEDKMSVEEASVVVENKVTEEPVAQHDQDSWSKTGSEMDFSYKEAEEENESKQSTLNEEAGNQATVEIIPELEKEEESVEQPIVHEESSPPTANTDPKLASEYEEFMKAVSFDTTTLENDENSEVVMAEESRDLIEKAVVEKEEELPENMEHDLNITVEQEEEEEEDESKEVEEKEKEKDEETTESKQNGELAEQGQEEDELVDTTVHQKPKLMTSSASEDELAEEVRDERNSVRSRTPDLKLMPVRRESLPAPSSSEDSSSSSDSSDSESEKERRKHRAKKVSNKRKKRKKRSQAKRKRKRSSKRKRSESSSSSDSDSSSSSSTSSSSSSSDNETSSTSSSDVIVKKSRRRRKRATHHSNSEKNANVASSGEENKSSRKKKSKAKKSKKVSKKKEIKRKKRKHQASSDSEDNIKSKQSKRKSSSSKKASGDLDSKSSEMHRRNAKEMLAIESAKVLIDVGNKNKKDKKRSKKKSSKKKSRNDRTHGKENHKTSNESSQESDREQVSKKENKTKLSHKHDETEDDHDVKKKKKTVRKRRRERRSRSHSPVSSISKRRRRSPSTSPEHSPTPLRRNSTESKSKTRGEGMKERSSKLKHSSGNERKGQKKGPADSDSESEWESTKKSSPDWSKSPECDATASDNQEEGDEEGEEEEEEGSDLSRVYEEEEEEASDDSDDSDEEGDEEEDKKIGNWWQNGQLMDEDGRPLKLLTSTEIKQEVISDEEEEREEEEKSKDEVKEAKEKEQREADKREVEKIVLEHAEKLDQMEVEMKAQRDEERKIQREAEERALKEAEERALKEAEERAVKEAEERALKEAEERALKEAEERALKEAEKEAQIEAANKILKEAENKAEREAEERAVKEAEERAVKEAEENALKEAEEKAQIEAEELALQEAEEKALKEAETKAQREAEERSLKEAEERSLKEAEEKAQRETTKHDQIWTEDTEAGKQDMEGETKESVCDERTPMKDAADVTSSVFQGEEEYNPEDEEVYSPGDPIDEALHDDEEMCGVDSSSQLSGFPSKSHELYGSDLSLDSPPGVDATSQPSPLGNIPLPPFTTPPKPLATQKHVITVKLLSPAMRLQENSSNMTEKPPCLVKPQIGNAASAWRPVGTIEEQNVSEKSTSEVSSSTSKVVLDTSIQTKASPEVVPKQRKRPSRWGMTTPPTKKLMIDDLYNEIPAASDEKPDLSDQQSVPENVHECSDQQSIGTITGITEQQEVFSDASYYQEWGRMKPPSEEKTAVEDSTIQETVDKNLWQNRVTHHRSSSRSLSPRQERRISQDSLSEGLSRRKEDEGTRREGEDRSRRSSDERARRDQDIDRDGNKRREFADRDRRDRRDDRRRDRDRDRDRRSDRDRRDSRWERDRRDRRKEERSRSPVYRRGSRRDERRSKERDHYVADIPLPIPSVSGTGEADMDTTRSPASSPLVGLKRSLADSTISDSELVSCKQELVYNMAYDPSDKKNLYYEGQTVEEKCETPAPSPPFSPKRLSLDDRLEIELGVKKDSPPPTQVFQQTYPYPNYYTPAALENSPDKMRRQPVLQTVPTTVVPHWETATESRVVQVGNVLQVVPAEQLPAPSSNSQSYVLQAGNMLQVIPSENLAFNSASNQVASNENSQVVQVGNVLQVIPGLVPPVESSPEPTAKASPAYSPSVPLAYSPTGVPETIMPVPEGTLPFLSALEMAHAAQIEDVERRRAERARRRQEKEKRRLEKEKRQKAKIKQAAEIVIKKAMEQEELLAGDEIDLEEMRLIEEAMQEVPETSPPPHIKKKKRTQIEVKPLPPAGRGILVSAGFREKVVITDATVRKSVKFADGVRPGEGTSPSAGEDLPSPPPPPRPLPKEKRFKKKKKKKIKVKIIRQVNLEEDDDDDDDDISPPPPPPGSPPPPPMFPPQYAGAYPTTGFAYTTTSTTPYTVVPGADGTVYAPLYQQHHLTTTTTHTTTVQFAPPPPPPPPAGVKREFP